MAHDVRAIANFVLDNADRSSIGVSNLALNKVIYFLHVAFLHEFGEPLIDAKIEAWNHGPVFREIYHQFKTFGRSDIRSRAKKLDVISGQYLQVGYELDEQCEAFLEGQCARLIRTPAGTLVDLSHIEDGAWHQARYQDGRINPGIEITDGLILAAGSHKSRH